MQRHPGPDWDSGGKDISLMIQWVQANISKYKGNPDRMFIWAQSAGNGPLGVYIGRPELWGPKGVGVKGAIFMSGQFNILPVQPAAGGRGGRGGAGGGDVLAGAGTTCGLPAGAAFSNAGAISGPSRADDPPAARGGRAGGGGGAGRGRGPQIDAATQLARSSLPELKKTKVAILLASAELDPGRRRSHEPVQSGPARRALQGRSGALPDDAFRKGREPHVRGVLDRHAGHDRFRTHSQMDEEGEVIIVR